LPYKKTPSCNNLLSQLLPRRSLFYSVYTKLFTEPMILKC